MIAAGLIGLNVFAQTPSATHSSSFANPQIITVGGKAKIEIHLKDASGTSLTGLANSITFQGNSNGTISAVTDNGDGTYYAIYTGSSTGTDAISALVNGTAIPFGPSIKVDVGATLFTVHPNSSSSNIDLDASSGLEFDLGIPVDVLLVGGGGAGGNFWGGGGGGGQIREIFNLPLASQSYTLSVARFARARDMCGAAESGGSSSAFGYTANGGGAGGCGSTAGNNDGGSSVGFTGGNGVQWAGGGGAGANANGVSVASSAGYGGGGGNGKASIISGTSTYYGGGGGGGSDWDASQSGANVYPGTQLAKGYSPGGLGGGGTGMDQDHEGVSTSWSSSTGSGTCQNGACGTMGSGGGGGGGGSALMGGNGGSGAILVRHPGVSLGSGITNAGTNMAVSAFTGNGTNGINGWTYAVYTFTNPYIPNSSTLPTQYYPTFDLSSVTGLSYTLSGVISGSGNVTFAADGIFTLSGQNTYTGQTIISNGTLKVQSNLGTGAISVSSGALLEFLVGGTLGSSNAISGAGTVRNTSGTLDLGGLTTHSAGEWHLIAGTISNGTLSSGDFTFESGTVSASLQGSGSLTKTTSGSVSLSGSNSYTGVTSVQAGTVTVSGSGSLGNGSALTVSAGATLVLETSITVASINNSGSIELNPGVVLNVTGNLTNQVGGTILLNASSGSYSQLKVDGTLSNSGTITQEQYFDLGWHSISSPMSSGFSTISGANSSNLLIYGNGTWSQGSSGDGSFALVDNDPSAFMSAAGILSVSGTPNTSKTFSLSYSTNLAAGGVGDGWNLIGNPYTCALDASTISGSTNVNSGIYIWNGSSDGSDASNYSYYSGAGIGAAVIAPMQGFWVQATSSGGSIATTMATNGTTTSSPNFYKTIPDHIKVNVTAVNDGAITDTAWIAHIAASNLGFDGAYDAWKMTNGSALPNISTGLGSEKMAINAVNIEPGTVIPLDVTYAGLSTEFTIDVQKEIASGDWDVYLEDKYSSLMWDLSLGTYLFNHGVWTDKSPRFALHLSRKSFDLEEPSEPSYYVYQNGRDLILHCPGCVFEQYRLVAADGRVVAQGRIQEDIHRMIAPQNHGLYILQLMNSHTVEQVKMIIEN